MLRFLGWLGRTRAVQTKCNSVEAIENIGPKDGGASRDRTDDLIVANDALSQLSYSPTRSGRGRMEASTAESFYQRPNTGTKRGCDRAVAWFE